jgi:hypothetical protein
MEALDYDVNEPADVEAFRKLVGRTNGGLFEKHGEIGEELTIRQQQRAGVTHHILAPVPS